jgi:hypothetical protein
MIPVLRAAVSIAVPLLAMGSCRPAAVKAPPCARLAYRELTRLPGSQGPSAFVPSSAGSALGYVEPHEYPVFDSLIRSMFLERKWGAEFLRVRRAGASRFLVRDTTTLEMSGREMAATFGSTSGLRQDLGQLPADLLDRFVKLNGRPSQLEKRFAPSLRVTLASTDDLECILEEAVYSGWDVLYQQYPGVQGVMTLSRVAFDTTGTRALVCAGSWQGGLEGARYCGAMVNRDGRWSLEQVACVQSS